MTTPAGLRATLTTELGLSVSSRLIALFLTVIISISTMVGLVCWQSYDAAVEQAWTNGDNLSRALDQHTARTFEAIDLSLRIVQNRVQSDFLGNSDVQTVHELLKNLAEASPQIRSIVVLDANGLIVQDSWSVTPRVAPPATDRDYFIVHKAGADAQMFVGPTIRNRINGLWSIAATRRISNVDGSFAGIALAIVDPDYFRTFYDTIDLGPNGSLALVDTDGKIIVRRPWVDALIGSVLPQTKERFSALAEATGGQFERASPIDGRVRMTSYRRLPKIPLVAVAALDKVDVLTAWRRQTITIIGTALAVFAVIGLIGVLVGRSLRRLNESERLFRAMFDNATDALFINRLSPDGRLRIEACNPAAAASLGLDSHKIVGKPLDDFMKASDFEKFRTMFAKSVAERQTLRTLETLTQDNEEKTFEVVHVPLRDDRGRYDRVFISSRDITHLKRAEAKARDANRYLLIAEGMAHVGHWRVELPSLQHVWSPEIFRIYGLPVGTEAPSLAEAITAYHPDDRALVQQSFSAAADNGQDFEFQVRLVRPDGEERTVMSRGSAERNDDGEICAVLGVFFDITDLKRAEAERLAAADRLSAILQTMDQGLIMVAGNQRIEVFNKRALTLLELPSDFMDSHPSVQELLDYQRSVGEFDDSDTSMLNKMEESRNGSGIKKYVRRRPNGTMLEVRTSHMPDGGYVRTYTDLSELIRAEDQLRDSEARYRLLAETTSDVITRLNMNFKREYVSPGCRRLLGYEPEEMMGSQPSDAMHPDDAPAVRDLARKLIAGEVPDELITTSYRTRHKLGHWVWVEAGMSLVRDEATGEPTSLICSLRDISVRKKAEAAIAQSEARFRLLAENTSEMIILGSADSSKSYVSPGVFRILGFTPEELQAMHRNDYVHPDDLALFFKGIKGLKKGKEQVTLTYRLKHKQRGWILVEGSFRKIPEVVGETASIVASFRDVSERERQAAALHAAKSAAEEARRLAEAATLQSQNDQAEAERANRAKSDFLASMSHEIRTPLNGVLGYTDLLLEDASLVNEHRMQVARIQSAGTALLNVVNDILDFSEIEAGQIKVEARPFNLSDLLNTSVSIVRSLADQKGIEIDIAIDPDCAAAFLGDQGRLQQILLNLLNNAVKFTGMGAVTLSASTVQQIADMPTLRITVTDTGIGIPEAKRDRLFQRFSQVDGSIRREFGGTGLGLAICRRLVELMGGTIGLDSVEGQGSSFWIELPLPVVELAACAEPVKVEAIVTAPASILVVEDVAMNQDIARAMLQSAGHTVDVVKDGTEAIMAVQEKPYDLVFMDVQMAGMDGITATRHIRDLDHPARDVPIVALTANVMPTQISAFEAAGMDDHVGKPFKREELYAKVAKWVRQEPATLAKATIDEPATEEIVFDRPAYEAIRETVGDDKMGEFLEQLTDRLVTAFANDRLETAEPETLAADAHKMAMAGMLGFPALANLCSELELACNAKADLIELLDRLRQSRDMALAEIRQLRAAS